MENTESYVNISHNYISINDKYQKTLEKYIVGVFISRKGGDILFSKSFDPKIQLPLIGNFIGALSLFGEENLGAIKRILVEGLNLEMNIVSKHDLIMTMVFRPNLVKEHSIEYYEHCLDLFYSDFQEQIDTGSTKLNDYYPFEPKLNEILAEYLSVFQK